MKELLQKYRADITEEQAEKFDLYYRLLVDWNENKCNLTAVTEKEDVAKKHFLDSLLPMMLIEKGAKCIDIGTGAGFPGVPLKIMRPDIDIVLMDSLQKRIDFLDELLKKLDINAKTIHARCEDAGRDVRLRGKFDIALTRAVSQTNILLEWTVPFLKIGGRSLMYKSVTAQEELSECKNACNILCVDTEIERFTAPWGERCVIIGTKTAKTPKEYPRKAGTAKKKPL